METDLTFPGVEWRSRPIQQQPRPRIIVIAGTASNTGKTTLLCDLLRALTPDAPWEAIKVSRGHYRSCGKDPHACCVSHLLGEQPTIRSGRAETYAPGKDTGRYWDAGASNVHWVIATNEQVGLGLEQALARVQTGRVLIEGTSVLQHLKPDFAILAGDPQQPKLKPTARQALLAGQIDALYLPEPAAAANLPVFTPQSFHELLERVRAS
jgi:molybdopterin-guanine dinucleotide biosynthesis protein